MEKYTAQAPTIEEASQKGLEVLGIKEEEATIEVIQESKKGFLGIGQKDAIVTVRKQVVNKIDEDAFIETVTGESSTVEEQPDSVRKKWTGTDLPIAVEEPEEDDDYANEQPGIERDDDQAIQMVAEYLRDVAEGLGSAGTVNAQVANHQVIFQLETTKPAIVIGKHGKVLNALQSLAQVLLHRHAKTKFVAIVNAGDYRERREEALKKLAERTAEQVRRTNQPIFLEPMPSFERKEIHYYLSKNEWVATHSEGKEPHRYLVVEPSDKKL